MRKILGYTLHFESNFPESIEERGIFVSVGIEFDGGVWCARYQAIRSTSKAIFPKASKKEGFLSLFVLSWTAVYGAPDTGLYTPLRKQFS